MELTGHELKKKIYKNPVKNIFERLNPSARTNINGASAFDEYISARSTVYFGIVDMEDDDSVDGEDGYILYLSFTNDGYTEDSIDLGDIDEYERTIYYTLVDTPIWRYLDSLRLSEEMECQYNIYDELCIDRAALRRNLERRGAVYSRDLSEV